MTEPSPPMTDPAREMADLLSTLVQSDGNPSGDKHLAAKFGVEPWSQSFYRIIATIMDRLSDLENIVQDLPLDDDYKAEMKQHIKEISQAFTPHAFQNHWGQVGATRLGPSNLQPLKSLSGLVRQKISYRKLSDEDLAELKTQISDLLGWLEEHQLAENDFIRQSLIEGLTHLLFRIERLRWLGWGYAIESLREVIAAYMLLERQGIDPNINPDAGAVLAKVGGVIKTVYGKLQKTKSAVDTADWVLKAYGAASMFEAARPVIKGLLRGP